MSRALASVCILMGLCGTLAGCAPHTRAQVPPVNQHPITPPKVEWPAPTWVARFTKSTHLHNCISVEQSRLCVGELGERWLDERDGAVASPYLAPETLVAALPTASQRFMFVGQRGTRYSADTALGPFTTVQPATRRFEAFQVVAGLWYGIDSRGQFWRGAFEDPVGSRVSIADDLLDFAVAPSGKGLALSLPEKLWWTHDAGEHWRALDASPIGATRISLDDDGGLRLFALLPGRQSPAQEYRIADAKAATAAQVKLRAEPVLMPDVRALDEGRAVWTRNEWLELRPDNGGWYLARGRFDAPLNVIRTRGLDDCEAVKLAFHSPRLLVVCQTRQAKPGLPLQVRVADATASNFVAVMDAKGGLPRVHLAALDANRVLAAGLCLPAVTTPVRSDPQRRRWMTAKHANDCADHGLAVISLKPNASRVQALLRPVTAPGANLVAAHLAVSEDGRAAAFVARSRPDAAWQLYLSADGGESFSAHAIDGLPAPGASRLSGVTRTVPDTSEGRSVQSLNFGEDRSLALVLRNGDAPVVYNFDDRGQLIASSLTPPEVSRVDAVGTRILALSLTQRNVYQSLDRGASFELVGHLPVPACRNYPACPVICRSAGCLVGERFTRVSWGSPGPEPLDIAGNPEQHRFENQPVTERVTFRTPITCEVQSAAPFVGKSARAPTAEQVSVGDLLWYAPWQDWTRASAGTYSQRRGLDRVASVQALAPSVLTESTEAGAVPADAGLAADFDDQGLAFLRSKKVPKLGEPFGEVELAWMLFKHPVWIHSRFRDVEPLENHDFYLLGAGKARRLLPSLLSANRDGVFVSLHAEPRTTKFVTNASVTTLDRVPWPIERVRDEHWTKFKGSWHVYAMDETGAVLLRASRPIEAKRDASTWSFVALTVSNPRSAIPRLEQRVQLHTVEPTPILLVAQSSRDERLASISARHLTPDAAMLGPAFGVSLPAALGEPPVACSARDRRQMSRVVLPLLPHAARGIQVVERSKAARWLVATQAVLYANAERTCLDALWADTLPGSPAVNAVVEIGNLGHATIFRSQSDHLQASPARCKFDPHAAPPPEYETRLQARWNLENLPLGEH